MTFGGANAGHHLPAENCWFGNSLGFGELKGAGQVHGRVSQFSAVITDAVARDQYASGLANISRPMTSPE